MSKKKYKCKLNITYEVIILATNKKSAENTIFLTMADNVSEGLIPTDLYPHMPNGLPMPILESVDVDLY